MQNVRMINVPRLSQDVSDCGCLLEEGSKKEKRK